MIRTIAVDDEPIALDIIREHALQVPLIDLVRTFSSAAEALLYLEVQMVPLIFIDINMPDMSGLEFAEKVRHRSLVVFTTAYPEFAVRGFELAATDYLLKPITYLRFLQTCQLAESRIIKQSDVMSKPSRNLFVKDGYHWVSICFDELLYAKAEDNYVSLFTSKKRITTRMTLSKLLSKLPADHFVQVHKSYIINLTRVEKAGPQQVIVAGEKIPVSNSYRDILLSEILRNDILYK